MSDVSQLAMKSLRLQQFRCFHRCDVDFHPELTVLVAENGRGKSSILDGIAFALQPFVDGLQSYASENHRIAAWKLQANDVRVTQTLASETPQLAPVVAGVFRAAGADIAVELTPKTRRSLQSAAFVRGETLGALADVRDTKSMHVLLPVVAAYDATRLGAIPKRRSPRLTDELRGRFSGYGNGLSWSGSFDGFREWYRATSEAARDPRFAARFGIHRPASLLAAVRLATAIVLRPTGWESLDWDFERGDLVVEHRAHGRLPMSSLSDGTKCALALVGDLAHRCVRLNPHLGEEAPAKTPGVVMIDEVDVHLHPRWQQQLVGLLREAFPAVQFIVTTHSPHVLSSVDKASIRLVTIADGAGSADIPEFQTRGVESADVLALVMGVDPTPQVAEASAVSDYKAVIQRGEESVPLRKKIEDHFGPSHPVVREIDMLRSVQKALNTAREQA